MKTLVLLLTLSLPLALTSFSPEWLQQWVSGIWKLRTGALPYEADIRSKLQGLVETVERTNSADAADMENTITILLKLNQDGTFKQCDEGYTEGKCISGTWQLVEDLSQSSAKINKSTSKQVNSSHKLVLAMNRQYYGPQFDVVLVGCMALEEDGEGNGDIHAKENNNEQASMHNQPLTFQGSVQKGKYLHSRGHTSFFDPPFLASPEPVGTFSMEQSLAAYSIVGDRSSGTTNAADEPSTNVTIQNSDFYHKGFILTIEPLKKSKATAAQTVNQPVDIRSMPVTFFANNTFCAIGTNKILRGRYQVSKTEDGDKSPSFELSMAVSLFGAGRSAPGSVYSEGLGLTHEDERTYIGTIQQQMLKGDNKRFYVQGTVFFGTDLGEDARPEPVASFYLIEDTAKSFTSNNEVLSGCQIPRKDEEDDNGPGLPFGVFE